MTFPLTYCAVTDVRGVLARDLTHTAANAASLTDNQIYDTILDAAQQIDGALGYTFPTPFPLPPPPQVFQICRDIAVYLADLTYRGNKEYGSSNAPVLLRYKRATDLMEQLRSGQAALIGWPPPGDQINQENPEGGTILSDGYNADRQELTEGIPSQEAPHLGMLYPGPGGNDSWGRWW